MPDGSMTFEPIVSVGPVAFNGGSASCKLRDFVYAIAGADDGGLWCVMATVGAGKTPSISPSAVVRVDAVVDDWDGHLMTIVNVFMAPLDATHFVIAYTKRADWTIHDPIDGLVGPSSFKCFAIVGTDSGGTPTFGPRIQIDAGDDHFIYHGTDLGNTGSVTNVVSLQDGTALLCHSMLDFTVSGSTVYWWQTIDASGTLSAEVRKTASLDPMAIPGKPGTIWTPYQDWSDFTVPAYILCRGHWTGSDFVIEGGVTASTPGFAYPDFQLTSFGYDEPGDVVVVEYHSRIFEFRDTYFLFIKGSDPSVSDGPAEGEFGTSGASRLSPATDREIMIQSWWSTRTSVGEFPNFIAYNVAKGRKNDPLYGGHMMRAYNEQWGQLFTGQIWSGGANFPTVCQPIANKQFLLGVVAALTRDPDTGTFHPAPMMLHLVVATVIFGSAITAPLRVRQRDDGVNAAAAPLRAAGIVTNAPSSQQHSLRRGGRNTYI